MFCFLIAVSIFATLSFVSAIPNPASLYCTEMGYQNVDGNCIFTDGTKCEEWAFYRKECGISYIKEVACAKAGEDSGIAKQCCSGLNNIAKGGEMVNGRCEFPIGTLGVCSDCGNKICESWENVCNCPVDCREGQKGTLTTLPNQQQKTKTCAIANETYTAELPCCAGLRADKDTSTCIMEGKKTGWFRNMLGWLGRLFRRG